MCGLIYVTASERSTRKTLFWFENASQKSVGNFIELSVLYRKEPLIP